MLDGHGHCRTAQRLFWPVRLGPAGSLSGSGSHTDSSSHSPTDSNSHPGSYPDSNSHSHPGSYPDSDSDSYPDSNSHSHSGSYPDSSTDSDDSSDQPHRVRFQRAAGHKRQRDLQRRHEHRHADIR